MDEASEVLLGGFSPRMLHQLSAGKIYNDDPAESDGDPPRGHHEPEPGASGYKGHEHCENKRGH